MLEDVWSGRRGSPCRRTGDKTKLRRTEDGWNSKNEGGGEGLMISQSEQVRGSVKLHGNHY